MDTLMSVREAQKRWSQEFAEDREPIDLSQNGVEHSPGMFLVRLGCTFRALVKGPSLTARECVVGG